VSRRIAIGIVCAMVGIGSVHAQDAVQSTAESQSAGSASLGGSVTSTSSTNVAGTSNAGGSSSGSVGVSASPPAAAGSSTPTGASAKFLANPSSAQNPYYGSVTMGAATPDTLKLSLDDAIQRGIAANLAITEARIQQQQTEAQQLESLNELLPSIKAEGSTGAHQYNLATLGFNTSIISKISGLFPNLNTANFSPIVKVDVTQADAALDWTVLDYAAITRYRAAKESSRAAFYNTQSSRGLVVLNVGNQYLRTLADQSQIESAQSLLRADETLLKQAQAEHEAGTAARLDELRARVQFQTQQQQVIAVENAYDKDLILLKRMIGVPVEQPIQLTDISPYADLEQMSIENARQLAYKSRQDYQGMQRQLRAAQLTRSAARYERLPTLTANGNYGVTGVTHGMYHGTFVAMGQLKLPIFKEAQFRGDAEVAQAQQNDTTSRFADLKQQIDQQLRDSLLDLNSAQTLVQVSQQNVDLATRVLSDANDRFAAGVEDNLPVVQAQATLSQAQSQLISDRLQYNQAKLGLARNLGIVDTQYQTYLHGK
jgi:outer membrane protein TolC